MKLQPILGESIDEPVHFLAIVQETLTEEVLEFVSLSFDNGGEAQINKSSCKIKVKMFKVVIPLNTL